ncbi:hypothetical protein Q9189_008204, partial [Teloschistes chrysophthalmus]
MLKIAEAHIRLNHRVSRITVDEQRRWKIHAVSADDQAKAQPSTFEDEFDISILTAPFAFNGTDIDPLISTLKSTAEIRRYVE